MLSKRYHKKFAFTKTWWQEILAVLMLLLAIVFFRGERKELHAIEPALVQSNRIWVLAGLIIAFIYILAQGGIYQKSFSATGLRLNMVRTVLLFLKRNFVSIFLPAGGVSSLAYAPSQLRKTGFTQSQVHRASLLYGFTGLLSLVLVAIPILIWMLLQHRQAGNAWTGLIVLLLLMALLVWVARSIQQKGRVFTFISNRFPSSGAMLAEMTAGSINARQYLYSVAYSMLVEACGIFTIYVAMQALDQPVSLMAASAAYVVSVLLMIVSPFLRGLGAVELSMVFVLQQSGYATTPALTITLFYRVFEFWLPLLLGLLTYLWKGKQLFLRLAPALLTFLLGLVNIISVITPPIRQRLHLLHEYLPLTTIHASNLLVLFVGLALLVTAAYLFRGLRNAWLVALILSVISLVGHVTKALDYEEAILAGITTLVLIATTAHYYIRSSNKWIRTGLKSALLGFVAVLIFGFIGFYLMDRTHFGIDFTWQQSLAHALKSFLLAEDATLHPVTRFGTEFTWLLRMLGFFTWGFLFFMLIRPHISKQAASGSNRDRAAFLLRQFGNSAADYFKLYKDKLYFFSDRYDGFIAYRVARGFAIVLEEPVCAEEHKTAVLREFEKYCRIMGLKAAFYRVDENSIPWFNQLRKQKLIIGQEAIVDISHFTLEGKEKKSLRNGLNALQKKGFNTTIHPAPHSPGFIQALHIVSDDWLNHFHKKEIIFSQGMFDEKELVQQDIITLEDDAGNIVAFLNIIPDFTGEECTYDLIRKKAEAPGAAMDALIIKMVEYARQKNKMYLNLGMVPMTGIAQPANTAERLLKLVANKIKSYRHYRGLREFKEKYATYWQNKYLVYNNDFDLLQLPMALNTVMKPVN